MNGNIRARISHAAQDVVAGSTNRPRFTLNEFAVTCRAAADTWYFNPKTGIRLYHNPGERLMLMVSELVEAFEGLRKNKMDDHLPHRKSAEVEFCDVLIRCFDFCGEQGYDLDGAFWEKLEYNAVRQDHKPEARLLPDGKKF